MKYYARQNSLTIPGQYAWLSGHSSWVIKPPCQGIPEQAIALDYAKILAIAIIQDTPPTDITLIPEDSNVMAVMSRTRQVIHKHDAYWQFVANALTCRHYTNGPDFYLDAYWAPDSAKLQAIQLKLDGLWHLEDATGVNPVDAVLNYGPISELCFDAFQQAQSAGS
jgi:hypothetical protein